MNLISLGVILLGIYPACFSLSFLNLGLVSLLNFGMLLAISASNISSALFCLVWHFSSTYITPFQIISEFLDILFCLLFVSLLLSCQNFLYFLDTSPLLKTVKNLPAMWETLAWSLSQEDSLEKGMATHSSILPGKFHGQRSLMG